MLLSSVSFRRKSFFLIIDMMQKQHDFVCIFLSLLGVLQYTHSMSSLEVLFTSGPVLQGQLACLLSLAVRITPSLVVCASRKFYKWLTL